MGSCGDRLAPLSEYGDARNQVGYGPRRGNVAGETASWYRAKGTAYRLLQEISTLPKLSQLKLLGPPPHASDPVQQRNLGPRITPFLQPILTTLDKTHKIPKVIGEGGWSLGVGWENLKVLELSNLSQNAVS